MRPVVVYFNGTFVDRQNGAHARILSLLDFLITRGSRVVLYSYSGHPDCPWRAKELEKFACMYPAIEVVLDQKGVVYRNVIRAKKLLSGILPNSTKKIVQSILPVFTPNYKNLRRRYPDAVFIVNYSNGFIELNGLPEGDCLVETHDVDFVQFSKRFNHPVYSNRIVAKFRSEVALLEQASALISIAPPEDGLFRLLLQDKPVFYVPDYGLEAEATPSRTAAWPEYDLVFVGSDNPFNVEGLKQFLADHRDWLQDRTLAIVGEVGRVSGIQSAARGIAGVKLLGFVEDIGEVYSRSRAAISPVGGTGMKIKVVEALGAGLPVFGSRHTIDGLPPGSGGCVFPVSAAGMTKLLSDRAAHLAASAAAIDYHRSLKVSVGKAELEAYLRERGVIPTEVLGGVGSASQDRVSIRR